MMLLASHSYDVDGGCNVTVISHTPKTMFFPGITSAQLRTGYEDYIFGKKLVQDAFPFLNVDQREFLMTGMSPKDWKEMERQMEQHEERHPDDDDEAF